MKDLLNFLLRCQHRRTTFPITPARSGTATGTSLGRGTYIVCLDCGREFPYNWETMRIEPRAAHAAPPVPALVKPAATVS